MDGTLFNSNQEISEGNLAAIKKAQKQGIHFMIATGRSMETMEPTLKKYDLKCGLILMNGAEVRDENLNIVNTINIDNSIIPELSKELEQRGYIPEYMTNQGSQICGTEEMMHTNMAWRMICLDRSHMLKSMEEAIAAGKNSVFQKNLTRNATIEEMLEKNLEIRKMIVFNPNPEKNAKNRIQLQEKFKELTILSSYPENIEINSQYAQKGYGLLEAIKKMGIKREEVAVFGDGYNDISMFEQFPNSFAPVNAESGIKEKASEIIPSNNEDGVGKKIMEFVTIQRGTIGA